MKKKSKTLLLISSFLITTTLTSYGQTYENFLRIAKNKTPNQNNYSICVLRQDSKPKERKSIEEIVEEIKQAVREEDEFMREIGKYKKGSKSGKKNKSAKSIEEIIEEIKQAAREEDEFMREIGMYKKGSKSIEEIIEEIKQAVREEDEFMKEIGMYKKGSKGEKKSRSTKSIEEIIEGIKQTAREEEEFMKEMGIHKNNFSDISNHWASDYIQKLGEKNIISGFDNNKFNPEGYMTRAQIAAVLVKALDIDLNAYENKKVFEDVEIESWYNKFAYVSYKNNLISGVNGKFKPEKELSGEEAIQIFINAYEKKYGEIKIDLEDINNTEDVSKWAKVALSKAKKIGIIDKVMDPIEYKGKVKRGQVCALVYELIK